MFKTKLFISNVILHRSRPIGTSTACTTAHNTINSHGMLASHTHTLNSTFGASSLGSGGSNNSTNASHQQPDILKSTPDHQRMK